MTKTNNFIKLVRKEFALLVVALCGLAINLQAQVNLTAIGAAYTQNFNAGTSFATISFTTVNSNPETPAPTDAGSGAWAVRPIPFGATNNAARGGTGNAAMYGYSGTLPGNDWMFTPAFTLAAGKPYKFSYFYRNSGGTGANFYPEKMRVMVTSTNTAAGAVAGVPGTAQQKDYPEVQTAAYLKDSISFTPTTDGTFYLAFQAYSDADMFFLAIDDILVENMETITNDVSVTAIATAATPTNCTSYSATTQFTITVANLGVNAQTNFPVNWTVVRGATPVASGTETIAALAAGATTTFNITANTTTAGTYAITGTAALVGDVRAGNNARTVTLFNASTDLTAEGSSYAQGFETATTSLAAIGWSANDANTDNLTWGPFNNATFARTGTRFAICFRSNTQASNDWLFTNCFTLTGGKTYRLTFWRRTNGTKTENLKVFLANGTATPATATTQLGADIDFTGTTYALETRDFTPTTTGTYHIGFQQTSVSNAPDPNGENGIMMDDVTLLHVPTTDVAVTSITTAATPSNCSTFTNATQFTITVRNEGTAAVTNVPIDWVVRRGTTNVNSGTQTIATMAPGETTTFNITADLSTPGSYVVNASNVLVGDGVTSNNLATFTILNPLVTLNAAGQSYTQGFETPGTLAAIGWSANDANTDNLTWRTFDGGARTGTRIAVCFRSNTQASNDWLITNCFNLTAGIRYRVSFWASANGGKEETLKVYQGTSTNVANMTQLGADIVFNTGYTKRTVEFTPTTTGIYHFGIQQTSPSNAPEGNGANGVLFDDFEIVAIGNDLNVKSITTTATTNACGGFTATTPIVVTLSNTGVNTMPIPSISYELRDAANAIVTGPTTVTPTAGTIAAGAETTLNFTVDMSLPRGYRVIVSITPANGDNDASNDVLSATFVNGYRDLSADNAVYSENFSSRLDVAWTALNQSTVTGTGSPVNWGYSTTAGFGAGGSGGFFWAWPGTTAPANATLFSPCMNLVTGKVYDVNFKHRLDVAGTAKARLLLVRSNDAAGITNATLLRDYNNITTLTHVTVPTESFVVPTNGSYYLAIQLYSDGNATQPALIIDDFSITNTGPLQPPAAPATLTATAAPLQVDLSWTASTSTGITAPTSYRVDFSTTDANTGFTSLPVVNAPATTFSHLNLTAGTVYFYRVYATNSAGTSTLFAAGSATPAILAAPTNLVIATQTTANALTLNWTASPTATGYDIERATVTGGTPGAYTSVGTPSNTSFNNTGLVTGTVYAYRVRASKGTPLQYSAYSNVVTSAAVLELDQTAFGKQIVVSPNPTDGNFKVDMRNVKPNRVTFIITDLNGKEVHRSVGENEDSFDFNVTGVSKGTYLLYINADKGQSVKKVVIK